MRAAPFKRGCKLRPSPAALAVESDEGIAELADAAVVIEVAATRSATAVE